MSSSSLITEDGTVYYTNVKLYSAGGFGQILLYLMDLVLLQTGYWIAYLNHCVLVHVAFQCATLYIRTGNYVGGVQGSCLGAGILIQEPRCAARSNPTYVELMVQLSDVNKADLVKGASTCKTALCAGQNLKTMHCYGRSYLLLIKDREVEVHQYTQGFPNHWKDWGRST